MHQDLQHRAAEAALGVTATSAVMVWLAEIEIVLRIGLALVGLVSGVYATLYYRKKYRNLQ